MDNEQTLDYKCNECKQAILDFIEFQQFNQVYNISKLTGEKLKIENFEKLQSPLEMYDLFLNGVEFTKMVMGKIKYELSNESIKK